MNRLISYTFYPPAGATVKKGDTLLFEQAVLECESTATIFDFAFLRDDGDTLSIGFGGKCRSGVHSGAGWRIELGDRNGLWDFGRGHTVNLVFLVSEGSSTGPPKPLPGGGWYNSVNWDNVRFRADINTDWHFEEGS
ncbi:MAG: hypothetical protein HYS78_01430 [Parcubacteria group bacterium]|nr:hypothetical protein [Parcubacteria group bacterium]